jgi:glyoxylase-like metal-dependent hydrolase (beta-lactamase superfamily II)
MTYSNESEVPVIVPVPGIFQLVPKSHTLPQGRTNCFVIGDPGQDTLIVDPSPRNEREYGKLLRTLKRLENSHGFKYISIFITHHHPDHLHLAPQLAKEFSIPVTISRNSFQRLIKRAGKRYFEDIGDNYFKDTRIEHAAEGDVLTSWQGKPIGVYEVPGHDEGQLALAPDSMDWFLVGDLIQSEGTVVIPVEEGDMAKYFQTLERIIQLRPKILLPSHGSAQRSVSVLKKTLKHRKKREKQVLRLHKKNLLPEQMVEIIYRKTDKRLHSLALENIRSHLKKLSSQSIIK